MEPFDFFFVGAPKCGTTALTDWLEQNPDVSQWLGRLFTQRPTPLRLLARVLPQSLRYRVGQRLRRANTAYGRKIPLDPGLKASLEEELRPDIERLETLIERDLSHWRPASGAP